MGNSHIWKQVLCEDKSYNDAGPIRKNEVNGLQQSSMVDCSIKPTF